MKTIKIKKRDIEKYGFDFRNYNDLAEHFYLLEIIEDYVVENFDYSYDNIGDNTDFTFSGNNIILNIELV